MGAHVKRLVLIGVGAVILAACSSGGDAVSSTLSSSTTAAVATSPPPTSATTTTTSTTTSSTTTSTTLAPSTTAAPSSEDLIKQAVQDYQSSYWACGQAPSACDPTAFTAVQGASRSTITELVSGMSSHGLYFGQDIRGSHIVTESVSMQSQASADVIACWYDAGVVFGPTGPDGNPTVVDDQVLSYRYRLVVYLENGSWRVGSQETIAKLGEGDLCPSA